ncbi:MAG: sugar ABC transporter ATP-binding protein [Candidatus Binatia bacterium]
MMLLAADRISVRYGATAALDAVDVALAPGEIHAVVGENGAGKSTLLRALAGVVRPNAGTVTRAAGSVLAWVPQEPDLPPDCTAAEWIYLAAELRHRGGWLRARAMREGAAAALARVGSRARPTARVGALPAAQRKQVQLARALRDSVDVLLLDEPTAVLGGADAARLFAAVREAVRAGAGVVYVSHRLDEVLALADRITVLRDGRWVATVPAAAADIPGLVQLMVGRDLLPPEPAARAGGEVLLRVSGLATGHVDALSLAVRAGEIVGLAGLLGAGRSAVLEAVAGLRPRRAGAVECRAALGFMPEDRMRKGLVPTFSLRENIFLPAPRGRLRRAVERRTAAAWMQRLGIRAAGPEAPIASLSGGNQQKALLARLLRAEPRVLLLDEPTAGVDIGAKADIHAQIRALAHAGAAVLLASSELPELLHLCDRIVALYDGHAVGTFDARVCGEAAVAAAITGQGAVTPAAPSHTSERALAGPPTER